MSKNNNLMNVSVKNSYDSCVKFTAAVKYGRQNGSKVNETNEKLFVSIYSIVNSYRSKVSKGQQSNENYGQVMKLLNEALNETDEKELEKMLEMVELMCYQDKKSRKGSLSINDLIQILVNLEPETFESIMEDVIKKRS